MMIRTTLLTAACALALAACGNEPSQSPEEAAAPPATPVEPAAPAPAPAAETPAPAAATPDAAQAGGDGEAVVNDCSTEIEGNDAMQFNVKSITVPASCTDFTITLKHTGKMPVEAMGHNVVITTQADMQAVVAAGLSAGIENDHVPPDDPRVIAATELVGGGETTSVTFPVSDIQDGGPYQFFCSFPGHSALMKGTIQVE